ncbi:Spaf_1101 family AAA-like ATPase [Bacillus nakamurai]|uniref:Spaf_1101 family AAA-like ATPase n=1 Tax=Bacillus nakamurai TaxID=1793963 RepID=UPI001E4A9533|nr:AAA family ATPase [Bacillus nakamurai]MCC9022106.1 AAA family ATPase [Bacillus nakamurai]
MEHSNKLNTVYKSIQQIKKSYGKLLKVEFHIHTPASHDYRLLPGKLFKDMELDEVFDVGINEGLYTKEFQEKIQKEDFAIFEKQVIDDLNKDFHVKFSNFKEVLGYQLIAHSLYKNNIHVAVISDHNTINGFKKLQAVLVDYYKSRIKGNTRRKSVKLFLGIEISCSDYYHLVGIFDEHKFTELKNFVNKYIHSEEEGTYISCLDMVNRITEHGGIPYIAHINTSDFLGTNLYKKSLFGFSGLKILGLTNMDAKERISNIIKKYQENSKDDFCFIYEGDSHELNQLGKKNTWIKFNNLSFNSLKKAFKNHQFCIYINKPNYNDRFLKGIYIEPGEKGFLGDKEQPEEPFIVDFSRDLNCIIGGRGVGKSTILSILETAFTLEVSDINQLEYISRHNLIYIIFNYKNKDYILNFIPQITGSGYSGKNYFLRKAFLETTETESGSRKLSPNWITLYRVSEKESLNRYKFKELNYNETTKILENVYKKSYSINNIVELSNTGKISEFIRDIVLNGERLNGSKIVLSNLNKLHRNNYRKYLRENIQSVLVKIKNREENVKKAIEEFNLLNNKLIQIVYSPKLKDPSFYLNELELRYDPIFDREKGKRILNTNLTWDDIDEFVYEATKKFGYLEFLELIINKEHKKIENVLPLNNFISGTATGEYENVSSSNMVRVYNKIEERIFRNIEKVTSSLKLLFEIIDEFSLKFNINSKEMIRTERVIMKDIEELSLGQKVVAILTMIFNYGEHSADSTPLVIDQPEDNLDNLYIYQNLVKSLRKIKNKRQVIIATHSATIVTNADAEQVIILESDNKRGWLSKKGYPDDEVVLKHIVSILEGGKESFIHKKETYKTVLDI